MASDSIELSVLDDNIVSSIIDMKRTLTMLQRGMNIFHITIGATNNVFDFMTLHLSYNSYDETMSLQLFITTNQRRPKLPNKSQLDSFEAVEEFSYILFLSGK